MSLNWINVNDFSFHCLLLMERFQIRLMQNLAASPAWANEMGVALKGNPAVLWALCNRCPESAPLWQALAFKAPANINPKALRRAEVKVMEAIEDFVIYTRPELMDSHCDFILGWDKRRLFELVDLTGKRVLDVGSGSGRLTFAAAELAKEVYSLEPVATLREYLREEAARRGFGNVRVVDGFVTNLPYPDDSFDVVMSGHVVGDDYEAELAELSRVLKPGGWLLDCPGEDSRAQSPDEELLRRGFEALYYKSVHGGDVYRYKKQIQK